LTGACPLPSGPRQSGHRDLGWNEPRRNRLAENLRVAAALAEAGYDFRLVLGD
jgi:enterochelin esterase family protein